MYILKELENKIYRLNDELNATKKALENLKRSPARQISTILQDYESGIIIMDFEDQGYGSVRIKCETTRDFSMSFNTLKKLGYCIRSFIRIGENTYNVWFSKLN